LKERCKQTCRNVNVVRVSKSCTSWSSIFLIFNEFKKNTISSAYIIFLGVTKLLFYFFALYVHCLSIFLLKQSNQVLFFFRFWTNKHKHKKAKEKETTQWMSLSSLAFNQSESQYKHVIWLKICRTL